MVHFCLVHACLSLSGPPSPSWDYRDNSYGWTTIRWSAPMTFSSSSCCVFRNFLIISLKVSSTATTAGTNEPHHRQWRRGVKGAMVYPLSLSGQCSLGKDQDTLVEQTQPLELSWCISFKTTRCNIYTVK